MKIKLSTLLLLLMLSATCFSCQDDDLDEIKLDKESNSVNPFEWPLAATSINTLIG
jgi:hypothetical protein